MSRVRAKQYRSSNRIPYLTLEEFEMKIELFNIIGISKEEWLKYPIFFKESFTALEQQYLQLCEAGFQVNAALLSNYHKCRRRTISILKKYGFLNNDINVAANFVSHLEPQPENLQIQDLTDENSFEEVHHKILTRYLGWRLNVTQDEIEKLYRITPFRKMKSFKQICENMSVLESIGFTKEDLLKRGYLLKTIPSNLKSVLNELPELAGVDTRTAFRLHPKIIGKPVSYYLEVLKILRTLLNKMLIQQDSFCLTNYMYNQMGHPDNPAMIFTESNISDECIKSNLDIFTINIETLRLRMAEVCSIPELNVLSNSLTILRVVMFHNEARSRLSFLEEIKFRCHTCTLLSKTISRFQLQIREGKDVTNIRELLALLQNLLQSTDNAMEKNLRKHPYYCYVPLLEINESCHCLLNELKFPPQAVIDVIQIVLYSSIKILDVYKTLQRLPAVNNRKMSKVERLNLMLYLLEKDHHFNGNGIWRTPKEET